MASCRMWGGRVLVALLLSSTMTLALADRDRDRGDERRRDGDRGREHREYDARHLHNRHYPPRGVVVDHLPPGHRVIPYRGDRYFFHGGVWYRPSGPGFAVVAPPIGLAISVLPPYYTTVWVGGVPHYYADGIYYVWRPAQRAYVVVGSPAESEVFALPPEAAQQFVYPKKGQNEQQQAKDRYECHRWAVSQTDYDPVRAGEDSMYSQITKREEYQRATRACLEGRGYSVR